MMKLSDDLKDQLNILLLKIEQGHGNIEDINVLRGIRGNNDENMEKMCIASYDELGRIKGHDYNNDKIRLVLLKSVILDILHDTNHTFGKLDEYFLSW